MTELFLAIVTILITQCKGPDRAVGILYGLVSHTVYFLGHNIPQHLVFHFMGAFEALLVIMIVLFKGCSASKMTNLMIGLSFSAVLMDVYGWAMYMQGHGFKPFNDVMPCYFLVTILVFIYAIIRYDRDNLGNRRFLRDYHSHYSLLGRTP